MGLRDDILQEQNLKEQEANAKLEAEKAAQAKLAEEEKKAKAEAEKKAILSLNEAKETFKQLKKDLKADKVPAEWVEVYDSYLEKLKKELKGFDGNAFEFKLSATKKLYETYFYEGAFARYSPGLLLNEYMAKRLKAEGFSGVTFALERYYTYYSTEQDEINYQRETKDFERRHSEALREYERKYAEWSAKDYVYRECQSTGGINNPSHPGTPPRYPMMYPPSKAQSGKTAHYAVTAKASLLSDKDLKKQNRGEKKARPKSKIEIHPVLMILIIFVSFCAVAAILHFIIPAWREPLMELINKYPLTDLSNLPRYGSYFAIALYSIIPIGIYIFAKFL